MQAARYTSLLTAVSTVTLGVDADVIGDVTAVATVALGAVSKITGDVIAGTTITTAAGAMDGPSSVPPPRGP